MVRFTTGVSLRTDKHARFVFKYWQRHSGGALNTAPLMLEDMEREYTICWVTLSSSSWTVERFLQRSKRLQGKASLLESSRWIGMQNRSRATFEPSSFHSINSLLFRFGPNRYMKGISSNGCTLQSESLSREISTTHGNLILWCAGSFLSQRQQLDYPRQRQPSHLALKNKLNLIFERAVFQPSCCFNFTPNANRLIVCERVSSLIALSDQPKQAESSSLSLSAPRLVWISDDC